MVDYLAREMAAKGRIEASWKWFQACSFLEDTADALIELAGCGGGGLYHLDGNPGFPFLEIARGLNHMLGMDWTIQPADSPDLDNRLRDARLRAKPITERIGRPATP